MEVYDFEKGYRAISITKVDLGPVMTSSILFKEAMGQASIIDRSNKPCWNWSQHPSTPADSLAGPVQEPPLLKLGS